MKRIYILILSLILTFSLVACTNSNIDGDQDPTLPVETKDEKENDVEEDNQDSGNQEPGNQEPDNQEPDNQEPDNQEPQEEASTDPDETKEISDKWPIDFMPEAPVLEGDIVRSKEEGPKKYFLQFDNIGYDDAVDYVDTVKEAGFSRNVNEHVDTNIVKYKGMDEDNNLLIFIWNKNGITKLELIKK